ncbi:MAG: Transcriptional regulator, AraC family [Verrucomicrobiales bacterium]|nr:Transcriptional regulator, AraC family [Verrucomicrobiales bacterium]MDB6130899.1 Transcriptional regulator, AraC family [Verrucomicrobiales bacterium]
MSKWLLNVRHWEQTARFALYSSQLLAKYHRISLRELQRQFQFVYKVKVHQWLKHVRLTDAARLLQREVKIAEVAALVRYPRSNNFTRDFKRKFGLTPEEYIDLNCPNPRNELFAHQYRLLMQYIDQNPVQEAPVSLGAKLELEAKTKAMEMRNAKTLELQARAKKYAEEKDKLDAKAQARAKRMAKIRMEKFEKRVQKPRVVVALRSKPRRDKISVQSRSAKVKPKNPRLRSKKDDGKAVPILPRAKKKV